MRTIIRIVFILIAGGVAWFAALRETDGGGAETRSASRPTASGPTSRAARTIENFAEVAPGIYRGAQPDKAGFHALAEAGVKTVICLRSWHSERDDARAAGLKVVELPIQADVFGSEAPSEDQIKRFFEICLDPRERPVYFHCRHGKDRTGTFAALYRIEVDGWTADRAIKEMQDLGYHDIYKDLIDFVRTYRPRGFAKAAASKTGSGFPETAPVR